MSRYKNMFGRLDSKNQAAFVPFVVVGDPDIETSKLAIESLIDAGADALELGFPFSDPLADGPTIQASMDRALASGVTPAICLDLIRQLRRENDLVPIGLLVYANLVYSFGLNEFYAECKSVGVDSVLVADVPVKEAANFCQAAEQNQIDPILLCPPNIDSETLVQVARQGKGYTYLLSRAGVTGTNVAAGMPVADLLNQLIEHAAPPPLLGFGISKPEHVSAAINAGARGVIVGSAIVQIIQNNLASPRSMASELRAYASTMKAATQS